LVSLRGQIHLVVVGIVEGILQLKSPERAGRPGELLAVGVMHLLCKTATLGNTKRSNALMTRCFEVLERVKGIEPSSQAWEARILPLDHTRTKYDLLLTPNLGQGKCLVEL
jgi:hypothetical protein